MSTKTTIKKTGAEGVRWDLSDLYSSIDDPGIEKDLSRAIKKAKQFEQTFRGKINNEKLDAQTLYMCMRQLESISETIDKILSYAQLLFATDTSNPKYGAFLQSCQEKATQIRQNVMFFYIEWVAVDDKKAKVLLEDKKLKRYKHFLQHERLFKPHMLTEPEEKILEEKANTSSRAFRRLFDEVINNIRFKIRMEGKRKVLTESEVLALLYEPERKIRKAGAKSLTEGLKENSRTLTYIFNTIVNDHSINDRLRKFSHPMESRNLSNEISKNTVDTLMTSCEENYDIVASYYNLKRKILGYKTFYDYDRYAPIEKEQKTVTYNEAKTIVLDAFSNFSPKIAQIASLFFENNWIDAEIREGKRGGAFSHSTVPKVHPYVFINYTGKLRDVMVLAHELGHGIHQYFSRSQGYFHADTPLTTAETASVFGEMLVFHKLMEMEKDNHTKLSLMCSKLEDIFATVFRQIVLTRFEEKLHFTRREQGELSYEKINDIWMETNRQMFGNSVNLTEDYSFWWMYIPHFIHSPFYCYAYAFGELLVLALYQKYLKEGKTFVPQYIKLLKSGGSKAPEDLLFEIGVDISKPDFWKDGLLLIRNMVDECRDLASKTGYL